MRFLKHSNFSVHTVGKQYFPHRLPYAVLSSATLHTKCNLVRNLTKDHLSFKYLRKSYDLLQLSKPGQSKFYPKRGSSISTYIYVKIQNITLEYIEDFGNNIV